MVNGNILKVSFLIIIVSLCIVMIFSTGDFILGKISLDNYKGLLEILGIPTLIGIIVQSFLHTNIGGSNEKNDVTVSGSSVPVNESTGPGDSKPTA